MITVCGPQKCNHLLLMIKREVVQKDCEARNLNREDAMDHGRWKKMIKIG